MDEGPTPKNEFDGAHRILKEYYRALVRQMAEEIIQQGDDFRLPLFGKSDELIDNYSCRLSRLSTVYSHLTRFVSSEKPKGTEPLSKDEFRCFNCGGVIRLEDFECNLCGWTWK
jgi:hypothetical protein